MDAATRIVELRCQVPETVLAIGRGPIRLTWRVVSQRVDLEQLAYEVQTSSSPGFEPVLASTGDVPSPDQVAIRAPGAAMASREVRYLRARIATSAGWTAWSPVLRVEAGLLGARDWAAQAVTLPDDPGRDRQAPSPLVRREFDLPTSVAKGRLHVTAMGVHRIAINGHWVSDDLLAPGWTTYGHRLLADTYDVTQLVTAGPNVIAGALGDGWYRGRLGWDKDGDRCRYGRDLGLIAQLELELTDGTTRRIATDAAWQASTGEIQSADLYDGTVIDLREQPDGWMRAGYDAAAWRPVEVIPFDASVIEQRLAPPVRIVDRIAVAPQPRPDGSLLLDGGQNIAGFVRLHARGKAGDRVTVRHAEVLEPDGSLHTRSLRSAKATDTYILAGVEEIELEPVFTFHGFRYAEIETEAAILGSEFIVISSDTPRRGHFECSDPNLNQLHENVVWSQRGNFVSVPTDCPQRDERLGWTGDAQAFAMTACTLFDSQAFWASWLRDLALDQDGVLGVPSVVPDVVLTGEPRYGRAGWADAATIVPWSVYVSNGDPEVLREQLDSMRRWVDSLAARRGSDRLLGSSMQFGDWLDPDAPISRPWEAKTDSVYLANAFFAQSARLLADAGAVLGELQIERRYRALSEQVASDTWAQWADHAASSQTGCAVALQFRLAPVEERARIAAALAQLVRSADGRVATGFLGTPLVLPALSDCGYVGEAYQMLLRRAVPSWLYQVDQGATTVWERWDAIRPDGSIHPGTMTAPPDVPESQRGEGHMLSFNHYAYGAVIDWVYEHVAGIAPDIAQPGYRRIIFAPKPTSGIDWARGSIDTPYGTASITWRTSNAGELSAELILPFGTTGTFAAPATERSNVFMNGAPSAREVRLGPGRHLILVSDARIAGSASAAVSSESIPAR